MKTTYNSPYAVIIKYEEAMQAIDGFCMVTYGSHADFSDRRKIGIAYTTTNNGENELQFYIDLINMNTYFEVNGRIQSGIYQFDSYDEIIDYFDSTAFDEIVGPYLDVAPEEFQTWELVQYEGSIFTVFATDYEVVGSDEEPSVYLIDPELRYKDFKELEQQDSCVAIGYWVPVKYVNKI